MNARNSLVIVEQKTLPEPIGRYGVTGRDAARGGQSIQTRLKAFDAALSLSLRKLIADDGTSHL
ncbi:MAG: hypothetical protein HY827_00220 [Actinobacteria bacterium]|nr:hypothetical protein [Actinomycetota bacterium]